MRVASFERHTTMHRIGRSIYRKLYWGPLLCMLVLIMLYVSRSKARSQIPSELPIPEVLLWAFWVWVFLGRRVACSLVPLFVSTLSCPGCEEEIDAVNVWSCACGFHGHGECHILVGRCPSCGKAAGRINCPRCDCTILLW